MEFVPLIKALHSSGSVAVFLLFCFYLLLLSFWFIGVNNESSGEVSSLTDAVVRNCTNLPVFKCLLKLFACGHLVPCPQPQSLCSALSTAPPIH